MIKVGDVFGKLRVVSFSHKTKDKKPIPVYLCMCECGTGRLVRSTGLYGGTKSCGCLWKKSILASITTHGMRHTKEYASFASAKQRCCNPNNHRYSDYGGRGIKFLFDSFEQFYSEVGAMPTSKHTIDRIDVNKHYEPGNVKWSTRQEQALNRRKRSNTISKYRGVTNDNGKWRVTICLDGVRTHRGTYDIEEDAARAYDAAAIELHGSEAKLNFPQ